MMRYRLLLAALALLLVIALAACVVPREQTIAPPGEERGANIQPSGEPQEQAIPPPSNGAIALSNAIADVVEQVMPAVVFISAKGVRVGTGSGVIISPDGYILTNNHVVEGANRLVVTLNDGITLDATLVGTDPLTDLAVIKIEGRNLPTARFGDATQLRPGNIVVAIGNPLGLEGGPTITFGIVSNTERSFALGEVTFYDVIQTDAAINPGNSGGPLVDLHGNVVGINTVLIGRAQGIGFAIGAGTAQPVSQALIAPPHRVIRPWLGVSLLTVTLAIAAEHRLARTSGVLVARLVYGSPADKAGMREGDVITHFEGEEVTEATRMIKALWRHRVGERVEITFWRGQDEKKAEVELSVERP